MKPLSIHCQMLVDFTAMMCLLLPPISISILSLVMMMMMAGMREKQDLPGRGSHVEACAISKAVNYQTHHSMSQSISLQCTAGNSVNYLRCKSLKYIYVQVQKTVHPCFTPI